MQIFRPGGHGVNDYRALPGRDHANLVQVPGLIRSDQHRQPIVEILDEDRVVERMHDGFLRHPMAKGACSDYRPHYNKLPCGILCCRLRPTSPERLARALERAAEALGQFSRRSRVEVALRGRYLRMAHCGFDAGHVDPAGD